jgi:phosphatidylglycerol:prolipoprotein diacylglycerol transferase
MALATFVPWSFPAGLPGVIWAAALVAALLHAVHSASRLQLDRRYMYWTGVWALLGGLWGGHILSRIVEGSSGGLWVWLQFWESSKSYFGGLIGGALAGAIYLRCRKLPLRPYADATVPAVSLGYAIGRIGCFLNGDDYGSITHVPWAVVYPPGAEAYAAHVSRGWISPGAAWSLPIHPVQIYASLLGLSMFVALAKWRPKRAGDRLCLFIGLYGAGRFAMEWLRGDFRAVLGPLSLPQVFSLLFIVGALGIRLRNYRPMAHNAHAPVGVAAPQGPVTA